MLRQPHQTRLAKAKIKGHWRYIAEYQLLPERVIRVELDEGDFLVPAEDWYEVADVHENGLGDASWNGDSCSNFDLTRIKPGVPRARTRLKPDPIPVAHIVLGFIVLVASVLIFLILATLMDRAF